MKWQSDWNKIELISESDEDDRILGLLTLQLDPKPIQTYEGGEMIEDKKDGRKVVTFER
jgi:hypothetical protein